SINVYAVPNRMESGIAALDTDSKSERNTQRIHLAVIWVPSTRIICLLNVNWKLHLVQAKMKETVYYLYVKVKIDGAQSAGKIYSWTLL
ncbi:hypothetical protein AVEN_177107-1, partial [Araneus ventricosus]